jgi:hypothetical protein
MRVPDGWRDGSRAGQSEPDRVMASQDRSCPPIPIAVSGWSVLGDSAHRNVDPTALCRRSEGDGAHS